MIKIFILALALIFTSCSTQNIGANLQKGEQVNGFTLEEVIPVKEIDGTAYIFKHNTTKTPLIYLSNSDNNMSFAISFKTPPSDSTGVFHIFEHSVLAGSKNYPSKSLFFQVAGSSVNTFQNAMTFSDKTTYPMASTNPQDFKNLVKIYLDSVFYPNVLTNPKIFEREGWRYELDAKNQLTYNGIVFSEMKGAYANPTSYLWQQTQRSLFSPKSAYYHESGGDIVDISDLTFDQLKSTHEKFYNPTNSQIIFYGSGPIAEHLKIVNDDYLAKIPPKNQNIDIATDTPKEKFVRMVTTYPADASEKDLENKTLHARAYLFDAPLNARDHFSMQVLTTALSDFENSPLKKNLLSKKICKEMGASIDSIKKPMFVILCRGSNLKKKDLFNKEVEAVMADVQKNGLPRELLESALNTIEFQYREYSSVHRGLINSLRILDSWNYGGNPLEYVLYDKELSFLRTQLDGRLFTDLVPRFITSSKQQSLVSASADTKMMARIESKLKSKLQKAEKTIGRDQIVKTTKEFKEWNNEPVPAEVQNKVPKLKISDLDTKQKTIPTTVEENNGIKFLKHEIPSQGIIYSYLYFDVNSISEEWVPYLPLLADALGKVDTKTTNYGALDTKIHKLTGGISSYVNVFANKNDPNKYDARFVISTKSLAANHIEAGKLLQEILLSTKFESTKRIEELFEETYSSTESNIGNMASMYSSLNTQAKFSVSGKYNNALKGYPQLMFLREIARTKDYTKLNKMLATIATAIFQKQNLVVGLGYDKSLAKVTFDGLNPIFNTLPQTLPNGGKIQFTNQVLFDGATFAGQVQFLSTLVKSDALKGNYGTASAVAELTSSVYLLPSLREQGGAYGGGMSASRAGEVSFYTYRDPKLDESYKVIEKVSDFLKSDKITQDIVNNAILRTVGDMDYPLTVNQQVRVSDSDYFQQITPADLQTYRNQALSLNVKKVNELGNEIRFSSTNNQTSVIGQKTKIEASPMMKSKKIISL